MNFSVTRNKDYPELVWGYYGIYTFEGMVSDEPTDWGIARGRVHQLTIYSGDAEIVEYEEEWKLGANIVSLYHPIVIELEKLPTEQEFWKDRQTFMDMLMGRLCR